MNISILGCGWFGLPLAKRLVSRGHRVNGATTTAARIPAIQAVGATPFLLDVRMLPGRDSPVFSFFDCETLVITLPPKSGDGYIDNIQNLVQIARSAGIPRILYTSSTSVYDEDSHTVDELSATNPSRGSGRLVLEAEAMLRSQTALNSLIIRFGGLIGPGRSPAGFFKGRDNIPNGLAPVNLIHLEDCIGISTRLIEGPYVNLTVNAVAPHHPAKAAFYTSVAGAAGIPPPDFIMERQLWKIVTSKYLQDILHYEFRYANWFEWLAASNGV
ncbi:MAG TPA: NAD(P)H-binding protein [Puia sp.]|uniref:NAD(P)H-binding protein n=1 Tax=Puia sp. TaxID=2045100 RepID=UPI002BBD4446|nr:NAD(P)H-binding protein [Puia sp.]HVU94859.1 NAD(P)H-binding protein [Puia sp.]